MFTKVKEALSEKVFVRLTRADADALAVYATDNDLTVSQVLRKALAEQGLIKNNRLKPVNS